MELNEEQIVKHEVGSINNVSNTVVMTNDQIETLQKQIAAYGVISDQLRQLYMIATSSSQYDVLNNMFVNACPVNSVSGLMGGKRRHRWGPTPEQLRILERTFAKKSQTPSKERIKELTDELGKHGEISEQNIHNWFQNKRARMKRKPVRMATTTRAKIDDSNEHSVDETFGEIAEPSPSKNAT